MRTRPDLSLLALALAVTLSCAPASGPTAAAAPAASSQTASLPAASSPAPPATASPRAASTPASGGATSKIWYMAPDARCGSGKGTLEDPWCIQDALASERVKPGETIHARLNGGYKMVERAGAYTSIRSSLRGTADHRIVVRPHPPDQTTPTTLIRIACDQGDETQKTEPADCVSIESNWVDYYDFEVAYFGDPRREAILGHRDLPGFGTGVRVMADAKKSRGVGNRLINWVVHDTADNVFKTDRANPTDFYGMVNYNYGFLYNTPKVKRIGGHGFYLRNGLEAKGRSRGCDTGIDDSEPDRSAMVNTLVSGPLNVEGFGSASFAYQDYASCSCSMHRNEFFDGNFFLGRTLSGGCHANNNPTLGTRDQTLTNNWWRSYTLGYMAAGCEGVTIDGNYMFRAPHLPSDKYYKTRSPINFAERQGNYVNPCRRGVTFTNNTFWGNPDLATDGKTDDDTGGFRASWFPGGGNVYLGNEALPDRNFTAVRPNAFRPASCNVYVANFLDLAAVSVDLSACGLANGAQFEIRSIYDYMGQPVRAGTFSAAAPSVAFPMTRAENPVSNSVGHRSGGAAGSYPDLAYMLTKAGGNIFMNAFVVLTTEGPAPAP